MGVRGRASREREAYHWIPLKFHGIVFSQLCDIFLLALTFQSQSIRSTTAILDPHIGMRTIFHPGMIRNVLLFFSHQVICLNITPKRRQTWFGFHTLIRSVIPSYIDFWCCRPFDTSKCGKPCRISFVERGVDMPSLKSGISSLKF